MTSIKYEKVYSRLFSKIEAYDFIELSEEILNEFLCNWLHSASANPCVRKLFKTVNFDDELQELTYEMTYSVDTFSDEEFIIEVLALGISILWLGQKVKSINTISKMYGSKEEKWYSEANHLKELSALLKECEKEQKQMIADRGGIWNPYLDGE